MKFRFFVFMILITQLGSNAQINPFDNVNDINSNSTSIKNAGIYSISLDYISDYKPNRFSRFFNTLGFATSFMGYVSGNIVDSTTFFYNDNQLITKVEVFYIKDGNIDSTSTLIYIYNRQNQLSKEIKISHGQRFEKLLQYDRHSNLKKVVVKSDGKRISKSKHENTYCKKTNALIQTKRYSNNALYEIITYTNNSITKEDFITLDGNSYCYQIFIWVYDTENRLILLNTIVPDPQYDDKPRHYYSEYNKSKFLQKKHLYFLYNSECINLYTEYKHDKWGNLLQEIDFSNGDTVNITNYNITYFENTDN